MTPERLARVRSQLHDLGLDALLVTDQANRRYLSGFTAEDHAIDEMGYVVLVSANDGWLLTGANERAWAESETSGLTIRQWRRPWSVTVAEIAADGGWRRLGFEDEAIAHAAVERLREATSGIELVPVGRAFDRIRACKSADELTLIREAFAITDAVFAEAAATISPGMREAELARLIEDGFRRMGAEGAGFPTIVASGPHAARPHHRAGDRRIAEGEPVIIDMGARVGGYSADLTRTLCLGAPPDLFVQVYNEVLAAQAAALACVEPGRSARDADRAAREAITAAGFGDRILHSVGHGLGLRVHEAPSLSVSSEDLLAPGMVVTVEPGIYIPEWGGVRIEDVVLVTEDGCEVLTRSPKQVGDQREMERSEA